jgi:hypothetical protein
MTTYEICFTDRNGEHGIILWDARTFAAATAAVRREVRGCRITSVRPVAVLPVR